MNWLKSALTLATLLSGIAGNPMYANAQGNEGDAATALRSACRIDYRAHCTGNDPAPPIAAACLSQFYVNLSKNCQTALDAYNAPASTPSE